MHSEVFAGARCGLALLLAASLIGLPAFAGSESPLGVVLTADHARLDNASAVIGADVFFGDALATDAGGSLRLTIGPSQMYLLSSAAAMLVPHDNRVQARVSRGTVGFSTPAPAKLEVQTPLGLIRGADAHPIFGQVSVVSPAKMLITYFQGTLRVTDAAGGEKTIAPGETYEATLAPEPSADQNPPEVGATGAGVNWKHVIDVVVPISLAGLTACALWPVSPSGTGCF